MRNSIDWSIVYRNGKKQTLLKMKTIMYFLLLCVNWKKSIVMWEWELQNKRMDEWHSDEKWSWLDNNYDDIIVWWTFFAFSDTIESRRHNLFRQEEEKKKAPTDIVWLIYLGWREYMLFY